MFTTEIFTTSSKNWNIIKDTIISLENEAFGDKGFTIGQLAGDFLNENNIIVLLKNTELNEVVGFMYAKPIEDAEPERANEKGETAYLWDIAIKKEYRGRHLSGVLMQKLEEKLRELDYKYMDLCAVTANNYANNIAKNYKDKIVKSEPIDSKWGPQIYLRIRL